MKRLLIVLAFALAGCATGDFNKDLSAAHSINNGILSSTKALLDAKKIHSSDGQNVLDQTAVAHKGLAIARTLHKSDPKAGVAKLSATRKILNELRDYLRLKEKP